MRPRAQGSPYQARRLHGFTLDEAVAYREVNDHIAADLCDPPGRWRLAIHEDVPDDRASQIVRGARQPYTA